MWLATSGKSHGIHERRATRPPTSCQRCGFYWRRCTGCALTVLPQGCCESLGTQPGCWLCLAPAAAAGASRVSHSGIRTRGLGHHTATAPGQSWHRSRRVGLYGRRPYCSCDCVPCWVASWRHRTSDRAAGSTPVKRPGNIGSHRARARAGTGAAGPGAITGSSTSPPHGRPSATVATPGWCGRRCHRNTRAAGKVRSHRRRDLGRLSKRNNAHSGTQSGVLAAGPAQRAVHRRTCQRWRVPRHGWRAPAPRRKVQQWGVDPSSIEAQVNVKFRPT